MNTAEQQKDTLNRLIELSYEKRLAITRDDIETLRDCTEREITLLGRLEGLSKSDEPPTEEVIALARELKSRNALNDDLIHTHLQYVNTMIAMLTPDTDPLNNYYSGDGRSVTPGAANRPGMLDMSV